MYRGSEGMWSWIFHRVTGVGVLLFLMVHIVDTVLVGFGPDVYNKVIAIYKAPWFRIGEVLLVGALLYHALNGLRIMLLDFWASGTRYYRPLFWAVIVLFVVLFVPTAYLMMRPLF